MTGSVAPSFLVVAVVVAVGQLFGGLIKAFGQYADQLVGDSLVLSDEAKEFGLVEFQNRHVLDRTDRGRARRVNQQGDFTNDFLGMDITQFQGLVFIGGQPDFTTP